MNSKIGTFFKNIGQGIKKGFFGVINWVKSTAWIQPLLIVAVILGIILCIKPVTSAIGNLFNPDTTYEFYRSHAAKMSDVEKSLSKDGTSVILFYDESDSSITDIEKWIIDFNSNNASENINWYCVDVTSDDTTIGDDGKTENERLIDQFQIEFYDRYNNLYCELPESMKSSSYSDELTMGDDDGSNPSIPTPLLARYDDGELIGVKVDVNSSNPQKDLTNFILDDPSEWKDFSID